MHRKVKIPATNWYVCIRLARKICEHCAFAGATVDLIGFIAHLEVFVIIISGKVAFVIGVIGVYLIHAEENLQWRKETQEDKSLTKEIENAGQEV